MSSVRVREFGGAAAARLLKALIRGYQVALSPYLPQRCRFYPTCSQYALQAVNRYGAARGGYLAMRRLLRCHPFHPGGVDLLEDRECEACETKSARRRAENLPC